MNGERYTFDVYGLYNGLFVMADRQTGSVWTHYEGTVLSGPLAGSDIRMEMRPIVHTTWGEWASAHPKTMVLDWYPEFSERYRQIDPGRGGLGPQFQATILNWDDRLSESELVLGASVGDAFRAYVLADFSGGLQVVEDQLGGEPIVVLVDSENDFALAFGASFEGQMLAFTSSGGKIRDDLGDIWDLSGKAVSGPLTGAELPYVTSFITEWYGWAAYHPQTSIYGR